MDRERERASRNSGLSLYCLSFSPFFRSALSCSVLLSSLSLAITRNPRTRTRPQQLFLSLALFLFYLSIYVSFFLCLRLFLPYVVSSYHAPRLRSVSLSRDPGPGRSSRGLEPSLSRDETVRISPLFPSGKAQTGRSARPYMMRIFATPAIVQFSV